MAGGGEPAEKTRHVAALLGGCGRGLAVVGHQPLLEPGEQFEYTSWARIATPHGSMRGVFFCMTQDARPFEAEVPEFQLVYPGLLQ